MCFFGLILYSFSSSVIIFVYIHRVQNDFKHIFIIQFAWWCNDLENKESGLWCLWDSFPKYKAFWKTDFLYYWGFVFLSKYNTLCAEPKLLNIEYNILQLLQNKFRQNAFREYNIAYITS